tara:strand:- start:6554 stop:7105 length:552 start_codon:yes stop_codon:yes gene_type:complete
MACNVTRGRAINCKDIQAGISAIYITDFGGYGTITESGGEITNMAGTFTAFRYDVNGAGNSFTTTATSSKDTGTSFFSTTLSLTLPKLSKEDNAELKLLAYGRPHIVVADRNGNAFLLGKINGCSLSTATMVSGDARGDMAGYTLEFIADEVSPPDFINGATVANPFAGLSSASETITGGTNS